MIEMVLLGIALGCGFLILARALRPAQPSLGEQLTRLGSTPNSADLLWVNTWAATSGARWGGVQRWLARRLAGTAVLRDLLDQKLSSDLALLGIDPAYFSAGRVMTALLGFLAVPAVSLVMLALDLGDMVALFSFVISMFAAVAAFVLPSRRIAARATTRRANFRAAITAYMDLVAMRAASGSGMSEALHDAADIGQGWPFARIRLALADARVSGYSPARALGHLGEEIGMHELEDLSAQLMLVDLTGAVAETTLRERARSLRDGQLAAAQGKAGERSESMTIAQMLLGAGFLVFLMYPPLASFTSTL